jgi:hypothetical protein
MEILLYNKHVTPENEENIREIVNWRPNFISIELNESERPLGDRDRFWDQRVIL